MSTVSLAVSPPDSVHNEDVSLRTSVDHADFLVIDGVRITPSIMVFANAYEGKVFDKKLKIQNCGRNLAFIRVCTPTAQAFKIKAIPKGIYLSPGLKVVRNVHYKYLRALAVPSTQMAIHINDKCIVYIMNVTLSMPVVSVEPDRLDFGRIDAVNAATTRTIVLRNTGYKGTAFAIDLGRNELELCVEPMRGPLHARGKVTLKVEIIGEREGDFDDEFWIKTTPPQRVIIFGTIINPKIVVRRFNTSFDFTMLDFRRTYYGARHTRALMIKNFSSSNSMFTIMADIKGQYMPLKEARTIDRSYRHFYVRPNEGRMYAEKGSVVQVTFTPTKQEDHTRREYAACFIRIIRLQCCDVTPDLIHEDDISTAAASTSEGRTSEAAPSSAISLTDPLEGILTVDRTIDFQSFRSSIAVCLLGNKENARVTLRPDIIILTDLCLNQTYERVLHVKNESPSLPITLRYRKQPLVNVVPAKFDLGPSGSLEITVVLRPVSMTSDTAKVKFDLLSWDHPRKLSDTYQIVGSASLKIEYSITTMVKRESKQICCLKAENEELISKIEAPNPVFRLTPLEEQKKMGNNTYYMNYLKKLGFNRMVKINKAILKEPVPEYDITEGAAYCAVNLKCCDDVRLAPLAGLPHSPFIPLAPRQLYNILIFPTCITLHNLAPFTSTLASFTIENRNEIPVRVYLRPSKTCVTFAGFDGRLVIEAGQVKVIPFEFFSFSVGRYHVTINVVINESHVFKASCIGNVMPKTITFNEDEIEFLEEDESYRIMELVNNLNAYVYYQWDFPISSCFKIEPSAGRVRPERKLAFMLSCRPNPALPDIIECSLTSESQFQKMIQMSHQKTRHSVAFDTYNVDMGIIPLNRPVAKQILMWNEIDDPVCFHVTKEQPLAGITVTPTDGMLNSKDTQIFVITAHIKSVISFSTILTIVLQNVQEVNITIKGEVEFPEISLQPEVLQFRKISPYSFDRLVFQIRNLSKEHEISVSFDLDDFPELTVTESEPEHLPHLKTIQLLPREFRMLFLHFHPYHVSTGTLFLPFKINDIIGPPYISDTQTTRSIYFIQSYQTAYAEVPDVKLNEACNRSLPLIRIICGAVGRLVKISNLNTRFVYYGEDHYANKTETEMAICNVGNDSLDLCIRTDHLDYPFQFSPKEVPLVERSTMSYVFSLKPGEEAIFEASVVPDTMDIGIKYSIQLPVFINKYLGDHMFNRFVLQGVHEVPAMVPSKKELYFEPVPFRVKNQSCITLTLENHFENCLVSADCEINNVVVIFPENSSGFTSKKIGTMSVLISVVTHSSMAYDTTVNFSCTCLASCSVAVRGATENCILTSHCFIKAIREQTAESRGETLAKALNPEEISEIGATASSFLPDNFFEMFVNVNERNFPFFPNDEDKSAIAMDKRKTVESLESWIYSQGFFMMKVYRIPDSFMTFAEPVVVDKPKSAQKNLVGRKKSKVVTSEFEVPLVQLIVNLLGEHVKKYFETEELFAAKTDLDRMILTLTTYTKVLEFLRRYQVYFPNVEPHYLLNYEKYCLYMKLQNEEDDDQLDDRPKFYLYSKQCWMDLILQIIKVFVLKRTPPSIPLDTELAKSKSHSSTESFVKFSTTGGAYSEYEMILLEWLDRHYENKRSTLWKEQAKPKSIIFFDLDLTDSLALGIVTATYCPYAKHYIEDMFVEPETPEEMYHNACRLIQTWKVLKLSFAIRPDDIVKPCVVQIVLLVTYLYDVLPNYYPKEVITLEAKLTQSTTTSIEIYNDGNYTIKYMALFFGDYPRHFKLADSTFKVPPHDSKSVRVTYLARSVENVSTCLIFSGETPGHRYGKSMAFELKGNCDLDFFCSTVEINVPLYKTVHRSFVVESPFKVGAEYSIYLSTEIPTSPKQMISMNIISQLKIPRTFNAATQITVFNEEGNCPIDVNVTAIRVGHTYYYWYYRNADVGDWAVKFDLNTNMKNTLHEIIEVALPNSYDTLECICRSEVDFTKRCPKIIKVMIPSMNTLLWDARKEMIMVGVAEKEQGFWKRLLDMPSAPRIIKLLMDGIPLDSRPGLYNQVVETVEYNVTREEKSCPFQTLPTVVIHDCTSSESSAPLLIHASKIPKTNTTKGLSGASALLRLTSTNGAEVRLYKLVFKEKFHSDLCNDTFIK